MKGCWKISKRSNFYLKISIEKWNAKAHQFLQWFQAGLLPGLRTMLNPLSNAGSTLPSHHLIFFLAQLLQLVLYGPARHKPPKPKTTTRSKMYCTEKTNGKCANYRETIGNDRTPNELSAKILNIQTSKYIKTNQMISKVLVPVHINGSFADYLCLAEKLGVHAILSAT